MKPVETSSMQRHSTATEYLSFPVSWSVLRIVIVALKGRAENKADSRLTSLSINLVNCKTSQVMVFRTIIRVLMYFRGSGFNQHSPEVGRLSEHRLIRQAAKATVSMFLRLQNSLLYNPKFQEMLKEAEKQEIELKKRLEDMKREDRERIGRKDDPWEDVALTFTIEH